MTRLSCPRCGHDLYPATARWTPEGYVCAASRVCATRRRSAALGEEIDFLRSFGWSCARIAERLGVTASCVEKRLAAERSAA